MPTELCPFRVAPFFSPRPWGTRDLSPWYDERPAEPVGEAWLTGPQCRVETGSQRGRTLGEVAASFPEALLGAPRGTDRDSDRGTDRGQDGGQDGEQGAAADYPLLVKILFPHEKLSVQVHPDDAGARAVGQPRGKTECWYVLEAEPGASVALGLKPGVTPEQMRQAIAAHTLEDLVEQVPVEKGEMIFVDAGTVHAIGPGVVLLETQQTSDITYRLYDYGRPRELHIDRGIAATRAKTAAGKVRPEPRPDHTRLIAQRYFTVDRIDLTPGGSFRSETGGGEPHSLVAVEGSAVLTANLPDGRCEPVEVPRGRAVIVPACIPGYRLEAPRGAVLVRSRPSSAS